MNEMGIGSSDWVDLHLHSTKSDGSFSPFQLLENALKKNISLISITDHDTLEGFKELEREFEKCRPSEISCISGVEIGVSFPGGALHILGYGFDTNDTALNNKLDYLRDGRNLRNQAIVQKLVNLGIDITMREVQEQAGDNESQGRPHIAKILIKKKVVSSTEEAFDRYLGGKGAAYVKRDQCTAEEAITLIGNAGGLPFLAHPKTLKLNELDFKSFLDELVGYGLKGIEVFTPQHTREQVQFYKEIANEMGLMISAGSDFHGHYKPNITLGSCYNDQKIGREMISPELFNLSGQLRAG